MIPSALKTPSRLQVSLRQNEPDQAAKGPKRDRQHIDERHDENDCLSGRQVRMEGEQLGRELIDGEHVVLAQWWLRTVKSEVRRRVVRRL